VKFATHTASSLAHDILIEHLVSWVASVRERLHEVEREIADTERSVGAVTRVLSSGASDEDLAALLLHVVGARRAQEFDHWGHEIVEFDVTARYEAGRAKLADWLHALKVRYEFARVTRALRVAKEADLAVFIIHFAGVTASDPAFSWLWEE
jgi:hypothetical protein